MNETPEPNPGPLDDPQLLRGFIEWLVNSRGDPGCVEMSTWPVAITDDGMERILAEARERWGV